MNNELAIYGGPMSIQDDPGDIFKWPIITEEDELAVLSIHEGIPGHHYEITYHNNNTNLPDYIKLGNTYSKDYRYFNNNKSLI